MKKVQPNITKVSPIEKIISSISYITMGIFGLIVMLFAYSQKKKLRFFLNYNIVQSVVIGVSLAIFKMFFDLILTIFSQIKFLDFIAAIIYYIFSYKVIRIYALNLSFSIPELLVFILLLYILIGVILGRIFYIPCLSDVIAKAVKKQD